MRKNKDLGFEEVVQGFREQTIDAGAKARRQATFTEGGGSSARWASACAEWRQELLNSDNKEEVALGVADCTG